MFAPKTEKHQSPPRSASLSGGASPAKWRTFKSTPLLETRHASKHAPIDCFPSKEAGRRSRPRTKEARTRSTARLVYRQRARVAKALYVPRMKRQRDKELVKKKIKNEKKNNIRPPGTLVSLIKYKYGRRTQSPGEKARNRRPAALEKWPSCTRSMFDANTKPSLFAQLAQKIKIKRKGNA